MKKIRKKFFYLKYPEEEKGVFSNKIDKKTKAKKNVNIFKTKNIYKLNLIKAMTFSQKFNKINYKKFLFLISFIIFIIILFIIIKKIPKTNILEILIKEKMINQEIIDEQKKELKKVENSIKIIKKNNLILEFSNKYNFPKISIVIKVYNDGNYLNSSLISIQNQDLKDVEIIIVDDCSTDNSVNLIKEYIKIDSRIILIQNQENKGDLYSKTIGVLNSKGKYIMLLENKDMQTKKR